MALFGDSVSTRREPRSLVEFRAGKMTLSGTTVTADTRKGLVFMQRMGEDNLMHFCWRDRTSGVLEDDFIVFPGDAELKPVPQCKTGRVFLLKFKQNNRKFFYWLQEPKDDQDDEYLKKVNDLIDNPSSADISSRHGLNGAMPVSQLQSLLQGGVGGDLTPQQLMELINSGALGNSPLDILGGGRGASGRRQEGRSDDQSSSSSQQQQQQPLPPPPTTTSNTSSTSTARQLQLGDLQSALASVIPSSASGDAAKPPGDNIELKDVLTSDVLRGVSRGEEFKDTARLLLPPGEDNTEDVVTSPQFMQALGIFGAALSSGQLGPLMAQFDLGEGVAQAASTGNTAQFAVALEEKMREKNSSGTQDSNKS